MRMWRRVVLSWSLACSFALVALAQNPSQPAAQIQILSPEPDSYLSGLTLLSATVEPLSAATSATFSVDGRLVCEMDQPPFQCEWDAGPNIVQRQVRFVAALVGGGRLVRTIRTKALNFVEKVDVDAVQVTVTVTDDNGEFVAGLPRSAFHVYEDGRPQTISHFTSEDVPLELVVAVDISGSMAPSMPKLKAAVKEFLAAVPSKNQVTLLGFNDSVFALARKATDPGERLRAVDRLAPWGATALYDVILRGVDMLGRQVGRKAVVVFSDGEDQGSHVALDDVVRRLESSDVTLYMIGQGRGLTQDYLKKIMARLTTPTGGRAFLNETIDELQGAFEELLDELSNQYLVGYQPSNTKRDSTWREIRVEVDGYRNVRARQGYRAVPLR
jgi:Ca-activated chloride channel family protein